MGIPWWECSLLCNNNVYYKASEADNLCWPPTLAPKHSNPSVWRSIFFSIIMFVTLVVDNVATLVVVALVGDKVATVVVDFQNLKS